MHEASWTWRIERMVTHEERALHGARSSFVLHKRRGESVDHVVLKLTGIVLFFGVDFVVESPYRVGPYRSDVLRLGGDGRPAQWLECGDVSVHKLDRLTRALGPDVVVDVLKRGAAPSEDLLRSLAGIARPERVRVSAVDGGFIDDVAAVLGQRRRCTVVAVVSGDARDGLTAHVDVDGVQRGTTVRPHVARGPISGRHRHDGDRRSEWR